MHNTDGAIAMKKLSEDIAKWIGEQVKAAGKKGIVVGLSGGIDSACVAALAKKALGPNVLGLILPCNSSQTDEKFALKIAEAFGIETKTIPLNNIFNGLLNMLPDGNTIAKANLKPRLRMAVLYYFANFLDYLVAGTGNRSELAIGYFTKHGDGGCDILPLGELLKTEVRHLARQLKIPPEIIERPPTAGLWDGQTDEEEMEMSYRDLDESITAIEKDCLDNIREDTLEKVRFMIRKSNHKREKTPIFNSSSRNSSLRQDFRRSEKTDCPRRFNKK
jgi:NAD+ synthase